MMLKLLSLTLATLLVDISRSQTCTNSWITLAEESTGSCVFTDIDVYTEQDNNAFDWKSFIVSAAQGVGIVVGSGLGATLGGPAGAVLGAAMGQNFGLLVKTADGAFENDYTLQAAFEDKVNAQINQLNECTDEKIEAKHSWADFNELETIIENMDALRSLDGDLFMTDLHDVYNSIKDFCNTKFDTDDGEELKYEHVSRYLPVLAQALDSYTTTLNIYFFNLNCTIDISDIKSDDNEAESVECQRYVSVRDRSREIVLDLEEWIEEARELIFKTYQPFRPDLNSNSCEWGYYDTFGFFTKRSEYYWGSYKGGKYNREYIHLNVDKKDLPAAGSTETDYYTLEVTAYFPDDNRELKCDAYDGHPLSCTTKINIHDSDEEEFTHNCCVKVEQYAHQIWDSIDNQIVEKLAQFDKKYIGKLQALNKILSMEPIPIPSLPDATTCHGWYCGIENQYCPPDVPGSAGLGYKCCNAKWTEMSTSTVCNDDDVIPDATTCHGWDCGIENQYCPPDVPGSNGLGYKCCNQRWTEMYKSSSC